MNVDVLVVLLNITYMRDSLPGPNQLSPRCSILQLQQRPRPFHPHPATHLPHLPPPRHQPLLHAALPQRAGSWRQLLHAHQRQRRRCFPLCFLSGLLRRGPRPW